MKKFNKLAIFAVVIVLVSIYLNYREKNLDINVVLDSNAVISISQSSGNISVTDSSNEGVLGFVAYKGSKPALSVTNNKLQLNSNSSSVKEMSLSLPSATTYSSIDITTGAGNIKLPLKYVSVEKVNIQAGASNIDITLPGGVNSEVNVNVGSGNINFILPKASKLDGIRVVPQNNTSINLEGNDAFESVEGGIYQTKGFEKAAVKSIIKLTVGSAQFKFSLEE